MTDTLPHDGLRHTLLRASAGSGKTYQLSTRYLSLIHRHAEPSEVLATTFTRKAAGEVLGRVITRLADAVVDNGKRRELVDSLEAPDLTQDQCRRMLRGLTGSLHRLSISTIDGFFNRMAQSFRYELDLPAEGRVVRAQVSRPFHPVALRVSRAREEERAEERGSQVDVHREPVGRSRGRGPKRL